MTDINVYAIRIWEELIDSFENAADDIELQDAKYTAAKYGPTLIAAGCDIKKLISMMDGIDVIKIYPAIRKQTGKPWKQLLNYYKQDRGYVYSHIQDFLKCDLTYDEIVRFLTKSVEFRQVSYLYEFIDGGASHSAILEAIGKTSDYNSQFGCKIRFKLLEVLKKLREKGCEASTIEEWLMNLRPMYWKWVFQSGTAGNMGRNWEGIIDAKIARGYWLELSGYEYYLHPAQSLGDKNATKDRRLVKAYLSVREHQRSRWTKTTRIGDIKPLNVETGKNCHIISDEETGIVDICLISTTTEEGINFLLVYNEYLKAEAASKVTAEKRKLIGYNIDLEGGNIRLEFSTSKGTRSSKTEKAFFNELGTSGAG